MDPIFFIGVDERGKAHLFRNVRQMGDIETVALGASRRHEFVEEGYLL